MTFKSSSLGTIKLDKQDLRLAEQATYDLRGTFIVQEMSLSVIPGWKIRRERLLAEKTDQAVVAGTAVPPVSL